MAMILETSIRWRSFGLLSDTLPAFTPRGRARANNPARHSSDLNHVRNVILFLLLRTFFAIGVLGATANYAPACDASLAATLSGGWSVRGTHHLSGADIACDMKLALDERSLGIQACVHRLDVSQCATYLHQALGWRPQGNAIEFFDVGGRPMGRLIRSPGGAYVGVVFDTFGVYPHHLQKKSNAPNDHRLPQPRDRDCAFEKFGIAAALAKFDALDKDLFYMRAKILPWHEFLNRQSETTPPIRYSDLIPIEKAKAFFVFVKSNAPCS